MEGRPSLARAGGCRQGGLGGDGQNDFQRRLWRQREEPVTAWRLWGRTHWCGGGECSRTDSR